MLPNKRPVYAIPAIAVLALCGAVVFRQTHFQSHRHADKDSYPALLRELAANRYWLAPVMTQQIDGIATQVVAQPRGGIVFVDERARVEVSGDRKTALARPFDGKLALDTTRWPEQPTKTEVVQELQRLITEYRR